ncbi:C10 family peptidase [Parabacteroides faecis]|uniref:C10 family peptidase n=1 Tax=Parabacteroides faecis TaxID=1217282 RepID=UPI0035220C3E
MKNRLLLLFSLIGFFIISCTDDVNDNISGVDIKSEKIVLSPEEYVSVTFDNPKELSENEICNIMNDFRYINSEFTKKTLTKSQKVPKVNIVNKYYLTNHSKTFEQNTLRSVNSSVINVPIYEVESLNDDHNKDFALICGDERASKVLFYVSNYDSSGEINTEMQYFMELAKRSAISDIELIENIKSEKRESTLNKISKELNLPRELVTKNVIDKQVVSSDDIATKANPIGGLPIGKLTRVTSIVGPLSRIGWSQSYPYNTQMPIDQVWDGNSVYTGNIDVGCANIGIATLLSIVKPSMVGVTTSGRQILIDWDYLTSKEYLYVDEYDPVNSSPAKMVEMAGSLLRAIYIETKSTPDRAIVDGYDEDLNEIKIDAVISTSTKPQDMINYLQKMMTYSSVGRFDPNLAKKSLQNLKPVLLYGNGHFRDKNNNAINKEPYNKEPGHAWVIDGYCTTKKSGQAMDDLYWSVNMGWGRNSFKVYFKTENSFKDCDVTFRYNNEGTINIVYYTQEQNMIFNIVKK